MELSSLDIKVINQYIRSVSFKKEKVESFDIYPFYLPFIKHLETLKFHSKVTFIVGENGSGKSTLLEAIAVNYGFNPEGGTKNFNFSTTDSHSELHNYIKLIKGIKKPEDGFFFRAESFYNVASNIDELDREPGGAPIILSYGGKSLHKQSHGESFFSIFTNRFSDNSIYILDEPEAALSPSRQMARLTKVHDLVNRGCQFIIATHSPILMAYPDSSIYEIKDNKFEEVEYEDTDNYNITKSFLNNKEKFLKILLDDN